jgi:hypothetical protein
VSFRASKPKQAFSYHEQALAIATIIPMPHEEARALEGIACFHLQNNKRLLATGPLRKALEIYRRIGASDARRVEKTINDHQA